MPRPPRTSAFQLPWAEVHDLAARHGFQGVELTTSVLAAPAEERRQVAADVDARGLRAGGSSLPMRFDRDEAEYAAGLADLPRRAAAAAELGSRWCSAHVWPGTDELDLDANLEFHAERLRPVAETLLRSGIRFGIASSSARPLCGGRIATSSFTRCRPRWPSAPAAALPTWAS